MKYFILVSLVFLQPLCSQIISGGGGTGGLNQLTGDGTAGPGTGSQAFTLATVNAGSGTCGDATHVCQIVTNAKGLTTAQSAVAITGGTGNAAATVTTTFSATPTFTCPSSTAGTSVAFSLSTSLTANITSSTLSSCTTGSPLYFHFTQDGTGSRTVAMPAGFDAVTLDPRANASTDCKGVWDGTNWHGDCASKGTAFLLQSAAEIAAPTSATSCPAGFGALWFDSTAHQLSYCENNGAAVNVGSTALSSITAATTNKTIANGNNPQTWNWAQTTDAQDGITFGETSAATNGTLTNALANQANVHISTASASTAAPLEIEQLGITATTGPPALQIESTWNNASLVGEALLLNVTNTTSAAASKLLDLRVGNTAQFTVDKAGNAAALTSVQVATAPACTAGTAGAECFTEGTAFTNVSGTAGIYADSTQHEFVAKTNGSANTGMMQRAQPGAIHSTGNTALIATATLCAAAAGACNVAGQYHVHWDFIETGTACGTPGTGGVTFLLTWTDTNATTHSAVSLAMDDASSLVATAATFHFQTTLAAAWASGDFNISTNGTIIQYATGYTACGAGTGTYQLDATVVRVQ